MKDVQAARIAKNLYQKEWRKKNPDKVKASIDRYWTKKAEELGITGREVGENERNENDRIED